MTDKHHSRWLQEKAAGNIPLRTHYHPSHWQHWLHLLNELPSEHVLKNRRNLLIFSVIAILISSDKVDMTKASILGVSLSSNDQSVIFGGLLLGLIYFLIIYLVLIIGDHIEKSITRFAVDMRKLWENDDDDEYSRLRHKATFLVREEIRTNKNKDYLVNPMQSYIEIDDLVNNKLDELISEIDHSSRRDDYSKSAKSIALRQQFVWVKIFVIQIFPIIVAIYALTRIWECGISLFV